MNQTHPSGHSSLIHLRLEWDREVTELAQLAPDWALLRTPRDIRPGAAEIVVQVDGDTQRRRVHLPLGASQDSPRITLQPAVSVKEAVA